MSRMKVVTRKIGIRALIFLGYLFIGAGVFLGIERSAREKKNNLLETQFEQHIAGLKKDYGINETDLNNLRELIWKLARDGHFKTRKAKSWDFVNAFFFSGNVVTTIGYGHITPITVAGKIVCIIYAIIGIPIAGYFLRTVGNELNNLFTFAVKYFERRIYNREAEKIEMKSTLMAFILTIFWLLIGGLIFALSEKDWNFVDSFYFSFITLTTIGFGDLVPGLSSRGDDNEIGVSLALEMAALVYYVIGLSMLSGVIFSCSNFIEEKTKKLDMPDPMDAIRNLRIENLNTKAMKKLGYKMTNGPLDETTHFNLSMRRGTIVPDDMGPRKMSKLLEEAQRTSNKSSVGVPPVLPNGTLTRRQKNSDDTGSNTNLPISEEKSVDDSPHKDDETTEVDGISLKSGRKKQGNNSVLVDVDISPVASRRPSNARPLSASSIGSRRKLKFKANSIEPSFNKAGTVNNARPSESSGSEDRKRNEPPRKLLRQATQPEYRATGLPSDLFGAPISKPRRKVLERTASDSHTDEIEYNDIMDEILKEQMNTKCNSVKLIKKKPIRSPTPEFLSLTRQFSDESTCNMENSSKHFDNTKA